VCGRTGTLFAHEQYGVAPDIMTLGKGLGGGVPLSALLAKQSCSCFDYGDQGGTFGGNPLAVSAGVAVMRTLLSEGFLQASRRFGAQLAEGLSAISKEFDLGEVRGKGALLALELDSNAGPEIVAAARDKGLLLNAPRPHCLRFMPALNGTAVEIDEGLGLLRQILKELQ